MLKLKVILIVLFFLGSVFCQDYDYVIEDQNTDSPSEKSKYFTEYKILGDGLPEEKCSDRVLKRREDARNNGNITSGVTPTVSLGVALLIFIGVGVFAVGIAQAFQLVKILNLKHFQRFYDILGPEICLP